MQQVDVEKQDVAGLAFHALLRRIHGPGAMGARHQPRGAIVRPERVEECQRGDPVGALAIEPVTMQRLHAAPRPRLASLDLRQEERLLQEMMHGGQHDRQAANLLHGRIEVEQRMAPIGTAGNRPAY